ncbi:hypothetical protein EK0264_11815 [Epidermidibacterium keratini]|uniref:Uncharacterized protein n=1 Tax=Epidermidibacterium keratini TaxID=1891644 RepID=A0A7L4YPS3_9ACTN|nr:hypothetical protein [Epidermidibacterium keratini]QHC00903.1 hypothetical protein EK0264_11815 [Epidermidibacterium keratini]
MADQIAELRPLPGRGDVPTLTAYADGRLTASVPDEGTTEFRIGPDGVVVLAAYVTEVPAPRRSPGQRRLYRMGWHLMDANRRPVAWLGNLERDLYGTDDLNAFAADAGLAVADRGAVPYSQLLSEDSKKIGPGTSKLTAFVAPASQWALAGTVLAGIFLCFGWFVPDGPALGIGLGMFLGIFVGPAFLPLLGILLAVHRENRWYAKHPAAVLRSADRAPGLTVTASSREVLVADLFKTKSASRSGRVQLVPYDTTQTDPERWSTRGLVVQASSSRSIDIPAVFDPTELQAFSNKTGIPVGPLQTDPAKLPGREKAKVDEVRLKLARRFGRVHWLALLLWILVPIALVLAVLGLVKVLPIAMSYCLVMIGYAVAIPSAWGMAQNQLNASALHPDQIQPPQPAPQRRRN